MRVLFWKLSSSRPPFYNKLDFEIAILVINSEWETPINGTPDNYIKIYLSAWNDNPEQRPIIKNIYNLLKNIRLEILHSNCNKNNQHTEFKSQNSTENFLFISRLDISKLGIKGIFPIHLF